MRLLASWCHFWQCPWDLGSAWEQISSSLSMRLQHPFQTSNSLLPSPTLPPFLTSFPILPAPLSPHLPPAIHQVPTEESEGDSTLYWWQHHFLSPQNYGPLLQTICAQRGEGAMCMYAWIYCIVSLTSEHNGKENLVWLWSYAVSPL